LHSIGGIGQKKSKKKKQEMGRGNLLTLLEAERRWREVLLEASW
jgi:hypothetical protein